MPRRGGLRREGQERGGLQHTTDINVTSLVDVAFTLLVIFIITAPILQGGVDVNLPQAQIRPVTSADDLFIITIRSDGQIFLEETPISLADLEGSLAQLAAAAGTERLFIRADSMALVGPVYHVVAAGANAGLGVSWIGEPRPVPRR